MERKLVNVYLSVVNRVRWNKLSWLAKTKKWKIYSRNSRENLKKNSIDLYAATKSLYLQNKKNKIKNTNQNDEDDWGNLDK